MICKWCGTAVDPAARSCSNCGHEIPPLSDCGGFYNIVPQATRQVAPPPEPLTQNPPVADRQRTETNPSKRKGQRRKRNVLLPLLAFALVALGVFCLLQFQSMHRKLEALTVKNAEASQRIEALSKNSATQAAELAALQKASAEREPEPSEPEGTPGATTSQQEKPELSFAERDLEFTVISSENGLKPSGTLSEVSYSTQESRVMAALEGQQFWRAQLEDTSEESDFPSSRTFTFSYWVEDALLGDFKNVTFSWYYYSSEDEDWARLSAEDGVTITNDTARSMVHLEPTWLDMYFKEDGIPLKCVVTRKNQVGGCLEISFEFPALQIDS